MHNVPQEEKAMAAGTSVSPGAGLADPEISLEQSPILALSKSCEGWAKVDFRKTSEVAAHLLKTSLQYYYIVQNQAQQSFYWALGFAGLGTLFFFLSLRWVIAAKAGLASISLISGALIQVISGINFYLYSQTTKQFAGFHICLERMDRYLLANSYCENLSTQDAKDHCRQKIIETMVNAPMLTLEQMGVVVRYPLPEPERAAGTAPAL